MANLVSESGKWFCHPEGTASIQSYGGIQQCSVVYNSLCLDIGKFLIGLVGNAVLHRVAATLGNFQMQKKLKD